MKLKRYTATAYLGVDGRSYKPGDLINETDELMEEFVSKGQATVEIIETQKKEKAPKVEE